MIQFVHRSLQRYANCDWGDLDPEDKKENDIALSSGDLRILSAYERPEHPKVWVITEADRSLTRILFTDEY